MASCGVKFSAYPNYEQANVFSQWIGCARVIYNCKVAEDNQNYKNFKSTGEKSSVNQAYSQFKTAEREWLHQCPSQILRNSSSNWYTAKQRFFRGLAQNPQIKKKGVKDTVLLTNELFSFKDDINHDGTITKKLIIGTKTKKIGELKFNAHREFGIPQQIVLSKKNNKWFVSFCYEVEGNKKTEQELLEEYSNLAEESLKELTVGIDRGIAIRQITKGHRSQPLSERIQQLNIYIRGWIGYFHLTKTENLLKNLDSWIRHRLRMCLFKQWRKPKTRVRNMMKLGLSFEKCKAYMCSKRYWYKSQLLSTNYTINNEFFILNGYSGVHDNWIKFRNII